MKRQKQEQEEDYLEPEVIQNQDELYEILEDEVDGSMQRNLRLKGRSVRKDKVDEHNRIGIAIQREMKKRKKGGVIDERLFILETEPQIVRLQSKTPHMLSDHEDVKEFDRIEYAPSTNKISKFLALDVSQ